LENVTFISALERLIGAQFRDEPEIASSVVDGRVRARLAVFLLARAHVRQKGLEVASFCRLSDLTAESSAHVAENLQMHADRPLPSGQQQRRAISLSNV
jgi:hypothetical protein